MTMEIAYFKAKKMLESHPDVDWVYITPPRACRAYAARLKSVRKGKKFASFALIPINM